MPIPASQSTFYVPTPSLDRLKLAPSQCKENHIRILTAINTIKNSSHHFNVSNASKDLNTAKPASLREKHIRFQSSIESGLTPPPLPPRAPRINNPSILASSAQPVLSRDMNDDELKNILKKPGDFQFDKTGSTPHLIHHSAGGAIVRTPVQKDKNGHLYVHREGWDFVNGLRMDTLGGLTRALQQAKHMNLVELPNLSHANMQA